MKKKQKVSKNIFFLRICDHETSPANDIFHQYQCQPSGQPIPGCPTPHPLAQPFLPPVLMKLPNCESKCLATQVETPVSLLGRQILSCILQREKLVGPEHYYSCTLKSLSTASCYLGSWCCSHPALPEVKMLNSLPSILWTNYPWSFHKCFCFIQPEVVFAACNEESYSIN